VRLGATRQKPRRISPEFFSLDQRKLDDGILVEFRSAVDAARCAIEMRPKSAEPVSRPRSPSSSSVGWISKLAFVYRKATASYALREPRPKTLKFGDLLIDPLRPFAR
jgi:hypothetical protein